VTAHQVSLHGLVLRVTSDAPAVLDGIRARLAHLPLAPDGNADLFVHYDLTRPPHERPADGRTVYESHEAEAIYSPAEDALYAFHRDGPTMRCAAALGQAEITGSSLPSDHTWVLTRPLPTLALMELVRRRGFYPLHAACLARNDSGVLVCGPSGSGKSTLTLALLEQGLDFLGDDLVFLDRSSQELRALGFPDELGLTENVRNVLPLVDAAVDLTAPTGWPKARASLRQLAPAAAVVSSCRASLLVVLSETATPRAFEEIDADQALLELLPSILLTEPATCAAHLEALAALTGTATTIVRSSPRPDLAETTKLVLQALS
jgi:hypothetical protein